jgi:hypothetical protein
MVLSPVFGVFSNDEGGATSARVKCWERERAMLFAAAVFTRAAVLAGTVCTGAGIDRVTPSCTRVQGNAECALIAGLTLSGDEIWISWPEDRGAGSVLVAVLAKGTARVRRGSESLSSKEAMVRIAVGYGKAKLHSINLNFSQQTELCQ